MSIDANLAIAMYAQGKSLQEIADELGCTLQGVRYVLIKHGVTLRPRGGHVCDAPLCEQRVMELRARGLGVRPIAKELGVNWHRVAAVFKRLGVAQPYGRPRTLTNAKIVAAVELRAQKFSWATVARRVGAPATTVRKALADRLRVDAALAAVSEGGLI